MAQRISNELMAHQLDILKTATGDDTLHMVCGERCRVETNIVCNSTRGCRHMGTGTTDALGTGYVTKRELYSAVRAAYEAVTRAKHIAKFGVTVAGIAVALFGFGASSFAADTLPATFQDSARLYPFIGTPAYSDSCTVTASHEDGSAVAFCTEDGVTYRYNPDATPSFIPVEARPMTKRAEAVQDAIGWTVDNRTE